MQYIASSKSIAKSAKKQTYSKALLTIALPLASVSLALFGIFAMSGWAEAAASHHALQHVVIFMSGVGFGGSALASYQSKYGGKK